MSSRPSSEPIRRDVRARASRSRSAIVVYTLVIVAGHPVRLPLHLDGRHLAQARRASSTSSRRRWIPLAPRLRELPERAAEADALLPDSSSGTQRSYVGPRRGRPAPLQHAGRLRLRAHPLRGATSCSCSCSRRTMMLPAQVLLIPQYLLFKQLGWLDTLLPLVVPQLLRQRLLHLPAAPVLPDDPARAATRRPLIDGANHFQIFWRIMLPLSRPILITVFALSFVEHWNDFFGPLIYLNTQSKMVVAVGAAAVRRPGTLPTPIHC